MSNNTARVRRIREFVLSYDNHTCVVCHKSGEVVQDEHGLRFVGTNIYITVDHWIPQSKGGHNNVSNLMSMCSRCNQRKGDQNPHEWLWKLSKEHRVRVTNRLNEAKILEQNRQTIMFLQSFFVGIYNKKLRKFKKNGKPQDDNSSNDSWNEWITSTANKIGS